MTPNEIIQLHERFDQVLSEGQNPGALPPPSDDPKVVREWQALQAAYQAIRLAGLMGRVQEARKEFERGQTGAQSQTGSTGQSGAKVVSMGRRLMQVAAALLVLLCAAGAVKYVLTTPSGIFKEMYSPYDLGAVRGTEPADAVENAYRAGDWQTVLNRWDAERGSAFSPGNGFLAGMANMELHRYVQASADFRQVIAAGPGSSAAPAYRDEAQYYLALAYLAQGQTASALPLLDQILADKDHLFHDKVMRLGALDRMILGTR